MGQFFSITPGSYGELVPGSYGHAGNVIPERVPELTGFLGRNTGSYGEANVSIPPIPFEWILSPTVASADEVTEARLGCPSSSATLLAFGTADLITVLATAALASRPVMQRLTFGRFGNRKTKPDSVLWTWSLHFALQLLANAAVAAMMGRAEGYGQLNMLHIFTAFAARPKTHVAVLAVLRCVVGIQTRGATADRSKRGQRSSQRPRTEFIYTDAYITAAVSEFFLSLIASIFAGVTWARYPGYPRSDTEKFIGSVAKFLQACPGLIFLAAIGLVPLYRRFGEAFPIDGRSGGRTGAWIAMTTVEAAGRRRVTAEQLGKKNMWLHRGMSGVVALVIYGIVSIVQYCYWAALLTLPGPLWCPGRDKLVKASGVWAVFTIVGNMVGGAA
jgi:hypothetical protein